MARTPESPAGAEASGRGLSRRRLVAAGAIGVGASGAALSWALTHQGSTSGSVPGSGQAAADPDGSGSDAPPTGESASGVAEGDPVAEVRARTVPFDGEHQAGVATPAQRHAAFVGFDLRAGIGRPELVRLLRVCTDDARRLCAGEPGLGGPDPALALDPASLTVTVGFGLGLLRAAGLGAQAPGWLRPLPAFAVDALDERWGEVDLLLQVCADDPLTVSHAVRSLHRALRSFVDLRWLQPGFTRPTLPERGEAAGARNLMGQVDGTVNPSPGTDAFDDLVWTGDGPEWLRGGTGLVLRRIRMDLDGWEALGREAREQVVGRRLSDGMPLVAEPERPHVVDLDARDSSGLRMIPPWAHVRRARGDDAEPPFLRRGYSYDDGLDENGRTDAGLLFAAYCANVEAQFVPVQRRLAELDQLNEWTTPVGSVVVAVPPGCSPDGYLGETLLG